MKNYSSFPSSNDDNHNNIDRPEQPGQHTDLIKKSKLTISEMAKINGISRQTLIYYDKHGIFQPEYVNDKGYRLYSSQSIPYLREICFLKAIGIKLEDIQAHIYKRNSNNVFDFLSFHQREIEDQIEDLKKKHERITNRLNVYKKAQSHKQYIGKPMIQHFPERRICFFEWGDVNMSRTILHVTLMKAWSELERFGLYVENGWGAMLLSKNLTEGSLLEGAGGYAYIATDVEIDENMQGVVTIPEGDFACLCKYGMPYEIKYVYELVEWIERNNYEIIGDIYDECFLDTTFYEKNNEVDFCQIQIPVRKKV